MPTDQLRRGAIVARGRSVAIVWSIAGERLVVLTVTSPKHERAGDVACDADAPLFVRGRSIRAGSPRDVAAAGYEHVGELPGPLMCRVCAAIYRTAVTAAVEERWEGHDEMAHHRNQPVVNLNS